MDTSLVRSPVYQQLNQRLRAALATEYRSGDQFLTEREVAEKFQDSSGLFFDCHFQPWMATNLDMFFRILIGVACNILFLLIIYRFWLAVFGSWDRLSEQQDQRYLVKIFSLLLSMLALPLALQILFSIPDWLKLVTWGYLCGYAVLFQVALFPVEIYIP